MKFLATGEKHSLEFPIPADQVVRRTIMAKRGLCAALNFTDNALSQNLAELHAPLVKRIDLPDGALGENGMLAERDELAQNLERKPRCKDGIGRAIALEHSMRNEPVRSAFVFHLLRRFSESQSFRKTPEQVKYEGTPDWLVPHRVFQGNRPSNTILAT